MELTIKCRECGSTLVKWRDYFGCPNGHGRLIREEDMPEPQRKPPQAPDWKMKLPVAKRRGEVTRQGKRYSIYSIDGKPHYIVDPLDAVREGQELLIGEIPACIVNRIGQRAVRRFCRYGWLTDEQKKRLSFEE